MRPRLGPPGAPWPTAGQGEGPHYSRGGDVITPPSELHRISHLTSGETTRIVISKSQIRFSETNHKESRGSCFSSKAPFYVHVRNRIC